MIKRPDLKEQSKAFMTPKHSRIADTSAVFNWGSLYKLGLLATVFLGGCGGGATNPEITYQFALKVNDFLRAAMALTAIGPDCWGQALRSVYYSAFTLARARHRHGCLAKDRDIHSRVWAATPKEQRVFFNDLFKPVRTRHDYDPSAQRDDAVEDMRLLLSKGVKPFQWLLQSAKAEATTRYTECNKNPQTCTYCAPISSNSCMRGSTFEEYQHAGVMFHEIIQTATRQMEDMELQSRHQATLDDSSEKLASATN